MTNPKNRKTAALIATILISTIALTLVAVPLASAHDPKWDIPSFPYLIASPNPGAVGQRVFIVMWIDEPLPSAAIGNDIRRHDYTLTITKPDGTKETQNWPFVSDSTSIQYYQYTPDQVGTYTVKFDYAGQTYTWSGGDVYGGGSGNYQNDTFLPASKTITFIVGEEPLPGPPTYPLPQEYWTRPIEGQNTDWWSITSNWLRAPYIQGGSGVAGSVQPDGIAPNSPHIMWTKPIQDGGVVGGSTFTIPGENYYMGGSYNVRFAAPIVMYGRLYYQEPYGNSGGGGDYVAVDLRTGEEIWRTNTTVGGVPSFGYLYAFDTPNQHGILPEGLLFATSGGGGFGGGGGGETWRAYDPSTGVLTTMNVTNVPSGTAVPGPQGEILRYAVANIGNAANPNWRLTQWNSSSLLQPGGIGGGLPGVGGAVWYSGTANASLPSRYDWNITLAVGPGTWSINRLSFNNIMLLTQGNFGDKGAWQGANITAVNLKPESRGSILWTKYYPPAPNNVTRAIVTWDPKVGVFVMEDKETMIHYGFSLADGSLLWQTKPAPDLNYFRATTLSAYGNMYYGGYGGVLYAYDMKTGRLLWTYGNGGPGNSTSSGLITAWGSWPIFIDTIADGKVYLAVTEHSPNSPYYKDARYRAINATDGTELWTLMGWGTGMDANYDIAADGFFVFANMYDMQIYTIGKGPSAMTVTGPEAVQPFGTPVIIKGTVTDISAGTKQKEQSARFPNGVPAVSDASMGKWMEYVYMQKPRPMDATGVEVTLNVLDSNGNVREIGKTTSDSNGFYSLQWTPDVPGKYTVYASFAGSESYWPSHAETAFGVMEAPEPVAAPQPEPQPPTEMYFTISTLAIIVAIAVVGALLTLVLRKRP
jgi:outer membrane protein assembly factor BamB